MKIILHKSQTQPTTNPISINKKRRPPHRGPQSPSSKVETRMPAKSQQGRECDVHVKGNVNENPILKKPTSNETFSKESPSVGPTQSIIQQS